MDKENEQALFFKLPFWQWATTGEQTFLEEAEHCKNYPPTGYTQYMRYCPNCGESWKGRINKYNECWGCGGKIREVEASFVDEKLFNHVFSLI